MIHQVKFRTICAFLLFYTLHVGEVNAQNLKQVFRETFTVSVTNPLAQPRSDVAAFIPATEIRNAIPAFNPDAFVVLDGKKEIPSQYNSKDNLQAGIILVLDQMAPKAARTLTIRYNEKGTYQHKYAKRTQAELSNKFGGHFENKKYIGGEFRNVDSLRVPDEHTDHSFFIRYEGPGWESDKVGYRFYLDWRNGTDVFGKTTPDMVLQQVGLDGFDSYHELQPWGMDVLKVGKSLGVGTLGMFVEDHAQRIEKTDSIISKITENGPVYSSILTNYYGWQVAGQDLDVQSLLSIHAGTRLTHHQVQVTGGTPENLVTGLNKDKTARLFKSKGNDKQWGYLATYGAQSLNKDKLGIAVLFRPQDFMAFTEDANSHVVKLKPTNGKLDYYFLAAWELEPQGIKTEEQFLEYLNKTAQELAAPVQVHVNSSK
ncbi:DUF4861 domain-containing protein [Pontibacter sp. 172403-2]|uniref:DUF4861 domain-containing protein n=1 Tax=Pontibacter rufus TaxID=2791028 RepID=UPI0018AFB998|nr:DUF4861 domain-containing protein [Pontibacter sp. 172403-2]MBF9255057.1 DUF4861 domain-containing protein [Pontibacter sp. 172403-2]